MSATDPDGPGQFKVRAVPGCALRSRGIDASTGQFTYTGKRYVDQNLFCEPVRANIDTDDHTRFEETHPDVFQVKVTDPSDPTGNTFKIEDVTVTHLFVRCLAAQRCLPSGAGAALTFDFDLLGGQGTVP